MWEMVYERARRGDPSFAVLSAPEDPDASLPLMVVVHPGDVTGIDLREGLDHAAEVDSQYLHQDGMAAELLGWLDRGWDVVVVHGRSSQGFSRRDEEAGWASNALGLHDNRDCIAQFDGALAAAHAKGCVMYGEDLAMAARELLTALKADQRPAVVLTGSFVDVGRSMARLGGLLEEGGATVHVSCEAPPMSDDAPEWVPEAGYFDLVTEDRIKEAMRGSAPRA